MANNIPVLLKPWTNKNVLNVVFNLLILSSGVPKPRHHKHRGSIPLRQGQQLVQTGLRQPCQVQGHQMGEAFPLSWYVSMNYAS